ncbi:MAG: DUF1549 and DUF1553 domain-containing protein, partial [Pirellulales bacterium]
MPIVKSLSYIAAVLATIAAGELARGTEPHWAFEPVRPMVVPDDASGWAAGPIDRFMFAKWTEQGLQPAETAERRTLARRVYFDLVGLPPQPDEVDAFVADSSPDAWPKLIERLLASPHYGERWGRHWMDVVRYADTAGDNADYPVPEARLYRDFIIDAFNADKPFDEFVREQLAGDILAKQTPDDREAYAEKLAATGFLALSRRYGTGPYELWHLTLEDTIDTTGRAFLGLSLRCARCHDHKFDPVTIEDYYGLYGIFASTQFPWAGSEEVQSKKFDRMKFVPLSPPADAAEKLAAYQARIAELESQTKELEASGDAQAKAGLDALRNELRNLRKPGLPADVPGAYAVEDGAVVETRVQLAGDPGQPGEVATRCVPRFLAADIATAIPPGASGRLQFAEWLTRPEHPLTARVLVNRIWQHHFGRGLVSTASNFGESGDPPTHPELLDWLAQRFVEDSWSIKAIHRLILLSKTYQLASTAAEAAVARDPANRWYARFERRRLDAESIRDAQLAVAGRLDRARPAEQPFPPIAEWSWTQHNPFKAVYPSNHRSVYLMTQRIQRHPFLALFDGPDPNISTDVRTSAIVPLQALWAMNDTFVAEQAAAFARRLCDSQPDATARIDLAHRFAYARPVEPAERQRATEYLEAYRQELMRAGVGDADA